MKESKVVNTLSEVGLECWQLPLEQLQYPLLLLADCLLQQ
jgi:hypothetical protein